MWLLSFIGFNVAQIYEEVSCTSYRNINKMILLFVARQRQSEERCAECVIYFRLGSGFANSKNSVSFKSLQMEGERERVFSCLQLKRIHFWTETMFFTSLSLSLPRAYFTWVIHNSPQFDTDFVKLHFMRQSHVCASAHFELSTVATWLLKVSLFPSRWSRVGGPLANLSKYNNIRPTLTVCVCVCVSSMSKCVSNWIN